MNIADRINAILASEAEAIRRIPVDRSYENAVELIHEQVHRKNGKLVLSGMGKAGQIAHNIATTFSSTGSSAVFMHPSEAQHGDLGMLKPDDVLIFVSNSGKTREIIELVELSRNLFPALPLVVITGNPESELGKLADITIMTGAPNEVCPLGLTPTTSTTTMTAIGDVLVVLLMEKIGFTKADYAKRHHGGYLGFRSRTNNDIKNTQNIKNS